MRLKLDENLGRAIARTFREAGHDVATVQDQGLGGIQDEALYERCRREGRGLVTLDLDFGNVLRFPPEATAGLAVVRPAGQPTLGVLNALAHQRVHALSTGPVSGRLWIIEPGRIRIHESSPRRPEGEGEHVKRTHKLRARGIEKILILDRGTVELGVPRGWSVEPDPDGVLTLKDPTDSCRLEVSYLRLLPLLPSAPPLDERLRLVLKDTPEAAGHSPVVVSEREGMRVAWSEYAYECHDAERGEHRRARGRWLLATNEIFQALLTYDYWADDTDWAVAVWRNIVETLRLGTGIPLESPNDHWSLREEP